MARQRYIAPTNSWFDKTLTYAGSAFESEGSGFRSYLKGFGRSAIGMAEDFFELIGVDDKDSYWLENLGPQEEFISDPNKIKNPDDLEEISKNESRRVYEEMLQGIKDQTSRAVDVQSRRLEDHYNRNVSSQRNILDSIMSQTAKYRQPSLVQTFFQQRQSETYLPSSIRNRGSTGRL